MRRHLAVLGFLALIVGVSSALAGSNDASAIGVKPSLGGKTGPSAPGRSSASIGCAAGSSRSRTTLSVCDLTVLHRRPSPLDRHPALRLERRPRIRLVRRISPRWAGYVATKLRGSFASVQATWVQPRIRCNRPNSSAAFWIGLGGATASATGLEQIGTSADCSESLLPSYSAWYEIIPQPAEPVELPIAIT